MNSKIRNLYISAFLLFTILCFTTSGIASTTSDILGITLGMSKENAHKKLEEIGRLDKNESKNQEIWILNDNARFSHLIVAFNKEYTEVRFITAKARDNGKRVRYSDVLDLEKALQTGVKTNNNYVLDIPAQDGHPAYKIKARGADPEYLTYFSIEQTY